MGGGCEGRGVWFALGDETDRARRVAAWSAVLAALAAREGGALHRLQWVARCLPGGFDDAAEPEAAADRGIAAANYSSLLGHADPGLWRHEVLVAVSVRTSSGPGRRRGRETAERMVGELDALERRCVAAGLEVGGALSPEALAAVIRKIDRGGRRPDWGRRPLAVAARGRSRLVERADGRHLARRLLDHGVAEGRRGEWASFCRCCSRAGCGGRSR